MATDITQKGVDGALNQFAEMMILRMEQMKGEKWQKPWISSSAYTGVPQNITGRSYSGSNSFFLLLHSAIKGYDKPCYLTFKQAIDAGCHIHKGEKSFPVLYWDFTVSDMKGNKIPKSIYDKMSAEERRNVITRPFMKYFSVFNVDQTNFKDVHPDKYQALLEKFKPGTARDDRGMYAHDGIDSMICNNNWVCPIVISQNERGACYIPSRDEIHIPAKSMFNKGENDLDSVYKSGMKFYSSLLHEMGHSTGAPSRLNRLESCRFGDPKYAKEELVAELTSAFVGCSLGFDSKITDNNAIYLDCWIDVLKKEPRFIVSLMSDVNKASDMIMDKIDEQQIKLGKEPYRHKNSAFVDAGIGNEQFKFTAVTKSHDGSFEIRTTFQGEDFGPKSISKENACLFLSLTDPAEKTVFSNNLLTSTFREDIQNMRNRSSEKIASHMKVHH